MNGKKKGPKHAKPPAKFIIHHLSFILIEKNGLPTQSCLLLVGVLCIVPRGVGKDDIFSTQPFVLVDHLDVGFASALVAHNP
jgi:hypothetical protein